MFSDAVMREIETVANSLKVEPAALAAVAHIESGLRTHAMVKGRAEPLIRFEGHYFDRRLSPSNRAEARRQGLASPTAGAVANPSSQAARWAILKRAAAIDHAAAHESVSWGMGQVMGAHWTWLGYASVDALVLEARSGVTGQLRLMARYIDKAGLAGALRSHDWASFSRGYNGPAYRTNRYDTKLADAYRRYAGIKRVSGVLKRGARSDEVRALQSSLTRHGYKVAPDGIFGPATEQAVRRFQSDRQLAIDGIVGPATKAALEAPAKQSTFTTWLSGFLRRLANI